MSAGPINVTAAYSTQRGTVFAAVSIILTLSGLIAAEAPTEFVSFRDGHTIAPVVYERLGDFLNARFTTA